MCSIIKQKDKMKYLRKTFTLLLVTTVIFISSCNPAHKKTQPDHTEPTAVSENFLITNNGAGDFILGEPLYKLNGEKYVITEELYMPPDDEGGGAITWFPVKKDGNLIMYLFREYHTEIDESSDVIAEIEVLSEDYLTKEGMGAGKTIEEFAAAYPDAKFWYTYIGNMYVAQTEKYPNTQFILNKEDALNTPDVTEEIGYMKQSDFKEGARIKSVRLWKVEIQP